MSIITNEEFYGKVYNRFDLILLATQRAKDLNNGAKITIENNHTATITALKEISAASICIAKLRDSQINSLRQNVEEQKVEADIINEENEQNESETYKFEGEGLGFSNFTEECDNLFEEPIEL